MRHLIFAENFAIEFLISENQLYMCNYIFFEKNPENSFQRYDLASICLKFDKSNNFSHYDYKPKLQKILI